MTQANPSKNGTSRDPGVGADVDMSDIRSDLASLREDMKSLFGTVTDIAKEKGIEGLESSRSVAADAVDKAGDVRDQLETSVRKNPVAAVAIAVGVGAFVATLRRR